MYQRSLTKERVWESSQCQWTLGVIPDDDDIAAVFLEEILQRPLTPDNHLGNMELINQMAFVNSDHKGDNCSIITIGEMIEWKVPKGVKF